MKTVRCLDCSKLRLRDHPKHANVGYGQCGAEQDRSGKFVSYIMPRDCKNFERADEEVILKRVAWRDQLENFRRVKT